MLAPLHLDLTHELPSLCMALAFQTSLKSPPACKVTAQRLLCVHVSQPLRAAKDGCCRIAKSHFEACHPMPVAAVGLLTAKWSSSQSWPPPGSTRLQDRLLNRMGCGSSQVTKLVWAPMWSRERLWQVPNSLPPTVPARTMRPTIRALWTLTCGGPFCLAPCRPRSCHRRVDSDEQLMTLQSMARSVTIPGQHRPGVDAGVSLSATARAVSKLQLISQW